MKKFWKWFIGILAGLLVLALLIGGLVMARFWGFRRGITRPMHGFGVMPYGHFGMMPFGGILGGLIGLGLLAVLVLGIIWLVRALKSPQTPPQAPPPPPTCAKCGKPVQLDWKVCPYCGTKR